MVIFPPAITHKSHDGEGSEHEVKDRPVECAGRFLAHLLSCFGTNGALRKRWGRQHKKRCNKEQNGGFLFHNPTAKVVRIFRILGIKPDSGLVEGEDDGQIRVGFDG